MGKSAGNHTQSLSEPFKKELQQSINSCFYSWCAVMESHTSAASLSRDSWTLTQPSLPPPQSGPLFKGYKTIKPESRAAAAVRNTQTVPLQAQGCLCLLGRQQEHRAFTGFGAATGKNDFKKNPTEKGNIVTETAEF